MAVSLSLADERKNLFRILAYKKASEVVAQSATEFHDLWKEKALDNIPGIGKGMKEHLDELFKTGHIKEIERQIAKFPESVYFLQDIRGIGPKTAWKIISSAAGRKLLYKATNGKVIIDKLIQLCKEHKIANLEGFGEKSETDILQAVLKFQTGIKKSKRINLVDAIPVSEKFLEYMKNCKAVAKIEVLGSLRRKNETVGDIDIASASNSPEDVIKHFVNYKYAKSKVQEGENKAAIEIANGMRVDLRVVSPDQWGTMLAHFTGNKDHNVALREYALKKGWSISEYGIKVKKSIKTFKTEEEFYKFLGLKYIPPEIRENTGEIEQSLKGTLPNLIELSNIKGDLQMHTNFNIEPSHDLGESTPEEMTEKAERLGYKYIAFTEHNPSLSKHTKKQISEILKKKQELVRKLNQKHRSVHIFNSLEVDILPDGNLAIDEEHLKFLDFIIVSIHSSFEQDSQKQTARILRALQFPKVKILGHPTGRLVEKRDEIKFDHEKVFKECVKRKIAVEIAASPFRNDPPFLMLKDLKTMGVSFIIDTDSHSKNEMDLMKFGVWNARKGWLEAHDVINTRNLVEIKKILLS